MFSIDYPYEKQNIASEWMDNVPLPLHLLTFQTPNIIK